MGNQHDPILKEENISYLNFFKPNPKPKPGVAIVYCRDGAPVVTLTPGGRLTAGEAIWGKYENYYEVNIAENSFNLDSTLHCKTGAFEFNVKGKVNYQVVDPKAVVEKNVRDAEAELKLSLLNKMRSISLKYEVDQVTEAEQEIVTVVKEIKSKKEYADKGLAINSVIVELSLEKDARDHIRRVKGLARKEEEMGFYDKLIEKGEWSLLAYHLTNNPHDVPNVLQMVNERDQVRMQEQLKALKILLEEDAIEGFQMEEASKRILQRLVEGFSEKLAPQKDMMKLTTGKKDKEGKEANVKDKAQDEEPKEGPKIENNKTEKDKESE